MTTQLTEIETQLTELRQTATEAIATTENLEKLEELRINYLGKKGQVSKILGGMGKLSPEERPKVGAIANEVKQAIQSNLDQKRTNLKTAEIAAKLQAETLDVSMPGVYRPQGKIHPLNNLIDRALEIFIGLGYTVATGPEMETDYYNFEALNTPP
ncbi:MAG: phenylalanine--tRNA ligase subunit alpha, partial [Okeania sp. SIO4D6]|nr:phenylalanine--tRNA ligase subunit alpha [Okeania sp. SIO4D6]